MLVEIGRRIAATVHGDEFVARLGGDEFAVLVHEAAKERAAALAEEIVQVVARPIEVVHEHVVLGVSIGIAIGPAHELEGLLEHADAAMYQAKAEGGRCLEGVRARRAPHRRPEIIR